MLGANKRRRACYRHLRHRCHGSDGCARRDEEAYVMEPGKRALQALGIIESETRDLVHAEVPSMPKSETDVEIAPLVQMIGELQEAKDFLQSEGERVQRETEHYTNLTQMASASVKIISDTVAGWREAGHPLRDHSRSSQFDLTLSPAEDNSTSARVQDHRQPQSQRPIRARTRGKQSPETASGEEQSSPV